MEDNYDEIAALFEEELRDLDFNDSGDDEYDESLAQIDALGAQLRQTLHGQEDEDEDAEWQHMMTMRKANARFQILEETVSGDWSSTEKKDSPVSHSEGKKQNKKKKKKHKEKNSPSPSPSRSRSSSPARSSSSPFQSTSQKEENMDDKTVEKSPISETKSADETTMEEKESEEEKSSSVISMTMPQVESAESDPDKIILDLMDTIVSAVASVAAMSVRPVPEKADPVTVDMSHLPKMFTAENEEEHEKKQVRFASTFDNAAYEEQAAILDEAANESEKAKVQAAIELLRMAEEKLQEEAEEERRLLERDRQQRLRRKQRMAEELLRARHDKAATSIQALIRRVLGRARCALVREEVLEERTRKAMEEEEQRERRRLEAQAEAEREEAEKAAEEQRKFEIAENRRMRQERELMLDSDLEMMAFVNEECLMTERERNVMAAEEESGIFLRLDPGGALDGLQEAIRRDWAERNREEDPRQWAVTEDGGEVDENDGQEECYFEPASDEEVEEAEATAAAAEDQEKRGQAGVKGSEEEKEKEVLAEPSGGAARLPPPSASSARRALLKAYSDKRTSSGDRAAAHQFRLSLVSATLSQALKPASFVEEGSAAARAALVPHAVGTTLLRSSPPPADQPQLLVTPSPRAKMGMRLASARPSPPSSLGSSEGGSPSPLGAEVSPSRCIFSQKLPRAGGKSEGLLSVLGGSGGDGNVDIRSGIACPLSHALAEWKDLYARMRASVSESRERYEADAAMEGKYSQSTTLMAGTEPPELNDEEQDALAALDVRRDPAKVRQLELKVEGLTTASFLRVYPHIEELTLNVNRLRSLDGLQYMQGLQQLQVKDNALTDISTLAGSSALRSLSLDDNQVADLTALSQHRNLERLSVNNNHLTTLHSLSGCSFPRLRRLEAYQNKIVNVPEGSLRGLVSLSYLDLGRNRLEWISGETLSHCVHLQTLVLSQNRLTELPSPLCLPHLQVLWLSSNQLRSLDAWAPSRDAMHNTSEGASADTGRAPSPRFPFFCPMLEKLHLQENQLSTLHEGCLLLCPALKEVDLSFNSVASPDALLGLAACPDLALLQLQENPVTTSSAIGTKDGLHKWLATNLPSLGTFGEVDFSNEEVRAHFVGAVKDARMARLADGAESEAGGVPIHERVRRYFRLPACPVDSSPFDPDLLQLLAVMRLELYSVKAREKLRRREVEVAVKGGLAREEAESIGAGEQEHADGLLESYTESLLAWPQLVRGWLPRVSLTARLFQRPVENDIPPLRPWEGPLADRCRGKNPVQMRQLCATSVQALIRGFISRRRLARAMKVSEYKDEELDFLVSGGAAHGTRAGVSARFNTHDDGDGFEQSFDLDEFLSEGLAAPELHNDYFVHDQHKPQTQAVPEQEQEHAEREREKKNEEQEPTAATTEAPPMVYGDHRSHKKAQRLLQESQKLRHSKDQEEMNAATATGAGAGGDRGKTADSADSLIESYSERGPGSLKRGKVSPRPMFAPGSASSSLQPASWADDGAHLRPMNKDQASIAEGLQGASPDGRARVPVGSAQSSLSSFKTQAFEHTSAAAEVGGGKQRERQQELEQEQEDLDRPMSAMTDSSEHFADGDTPRSRQGAASMSYADLAVSAVGAGGGASLSSRKQPSSQQADQLAQEWGIRDPKVLALMVKRSRKLQQGQAGASPVRGNGKSGASGMSAKVKAGGSGSFGGKPKTQRGNNRTAGRRGIPPAWAKPD